MTYEPYEAEDWEYEEREYEAEWAAYGEHPPIDPNDAYTVAEREDAEYDDDYLADYLADYYEEEYNYLLDLDYLYFGYFG